MVETGLALSILLTVALASAPGGAHRVAPPSELGVWSQQAVPIVISMIDDLRAIEEHTADPGQTNRGWLGADESRLRTDLDAAARLQPAPDPSIRAAWAVTVADLGLADGTLRAAAITADPATVVVAHAQFAEAGVSLLRLGQAVSPAG